jgi:hypothetical protein
MRKALLMTTGLAWLALTGAAGAVTVTLTPGPADPQYFAGQTIGTSDFTIGTTVWSGTGLIESGTVDGEWASPLGLGATPYLAVQAGKSETATFATDQTSLTIYWGSIDSYNTVAVTIDGYTLTGSELASLYGAVDDGSHTNPLSNQWVTISGLGDFKTATFTSSANSFEFSIGTGVPEPSTWAMMGLGFAALGYAAFRRNSKNQTALSAI